MQSATTIVATHPSEVKDAENHTGNRNNVMRVGKPPERQVRQTVQVDSAPAAPHVIGVVQQETQVCCLMGVDEGDIHRRFVSGMLADMTCIYVPTGTRLKLMYPQIKLPHDPHSVYMKTHLIDSVTAAVTVGYALCYTKRDGRPERYVGNFTAC